MRREVFALVVLSAVLPSTQTFGQALWTEDAESGLTYVLDHSSGSYPLIQSDLVSQGSYAFHLAHPDALPNWFDLTPTISIENDTKLFFQSRLGWASSVQSAKVQLSTDGGSSWANQVFSQSGTGNSGEGAFGLQSIDLSPYANQDVKFRFLYDLDFGSYFPQTDPGVGWYVDDIQIGPELSKTEYSIGNPSPEAQLYLEYVNRARADALVEAERLASETDPEILAAYNFFGINTQDIITQFNWYVANDCMDRSAQPLAFNAALNEAAELHSQDMLDSVFQGHDSSNNPPAPFQPGFGSGQRATATGYNWTALGENVFSSADSVAHGHAGFDVDWGNTLNFDECYNPAFAGQGMQNSAGHRKNIHNNNYNEVGIGVINGSNSSGGDSVGPQLVTQDFGSQGSSTFITGVVYEDLDGDNFYDIGEGRSGVRVDVDGSGFYAISSESGGYSVPVSGDGSYDVMFSGGGYADFLTSAVVSFGENVKVDYLTLEIVYDPADFNEDGSVDQLDLVQWQGDFGLNNDSDADDDGDSDGADFLIWQKAVNRVSSLTAVPEPGTAILAGGMLLLMAALRRKR